MFSRKAGPSGEHALLRVDRFRLGPGNVLRIRKRMWGSWKEHFEILVLVFLSFVQQCEVPQVSIASGCRTNSGGSSGNCASRRSMVGATSFVFATGANTAAWEWHSTIVNICCVL